MKTKSISELIPLWRDVEFRSPIALRFSWPERGIIRETLQLNKEDEKELMRLIKDKLGLIV